MDRYASLLGVSMAATLNIAMAIRTYAWGYPTVHYIQSHEIQSHEGDYKSYVLHVNSTLSILRIYGLGAMVTRCMSCCSLRTVATSDMKPIPNSEPLDY